MKILSVVAAVYDRREKKNDVAMRSAVIDRRYKSILTSIAFILLLTACSRLTETNLQKVHNGMTPTEVKAILGDPTSSQTGNALGIISGTTYIYHTNSSDVKITFLNDKVIATEGEFK